MRSVPTLLSPLLANIALNGIEEVHSYNTRYNKKGIPNGVHVTPTVRYADDMVVILRPEDNETRVFNRISRFLRERGLMASKKKTKLHASTEGFDYLGWHFKVLKDGRFKAYPSDENLKKFKKKVKSIVNCSNYGSKLKAKKLAPIVRGWRNYHKHCDMSASKHSLWFLHYRTWKVFNKEKRNSKESTTKLINIAFPKVSYSEHRFVKVRGNKSPYDNDINYWSKRNSKLYDNATAKALRKQNHTCGHCGLKFTDDEKVHLHHIDSNHNNWKTNNLMAVHESCHDYIHMSNRVIP